MRSATGESSTARFRLGGKVAGVETSFTLTIGEHRVGSSSASDIRLLTAGVSREHAVLRVTPDGLAVEDRGSKNGTFVDAQRVERVGVPIGAKLCFGPVELEVAEVDADDLELAIVIAPTGDETRQEPPASPPSQETASFYDKSERSIAETWLWLVEGFAARLFATPQGNMAAALDYLLDALELKACAIVEWTDGDDPVVLAIRGTASSDVLDHIPPLPASEALAQEEMWFRCETDRSWAYSRCVGDSPLGLVTWGDFPGRTESEGLFRITLRLLARLRSEGNHQAVDVVSAGGARGHHPELVFPAGYVPSIAPAMGALYQQMRGLLRGDLPVLIVGETGVGKEQLVSILHRSSALRDGPLVAINCAAIPNDLLEAELFGIGKGVATGVDKRQGKFQLAAGGTLFLDEIGEMQPNLQTKLLRALQEKQIQPLGGPPQDVDVRIVAATNADLGQRMDQGRFRRDLYYRLAGSTLQVPSLRDCPEDIPRLVEHFMRAFAREGDLRLRGITVKALRLLAGYRWPGNVRELQHEVRRLAHLCPPEGVIGAGMVSPHIGAARLDPMEVPLTADSEPLLLAPGLRRLEARFLCEALRRAGGRQVHAAKMLGISRNGLADKLKRFGIDPQTFFDKTTACDP